MKRHDAIGTSDTITVLLALLYVILLRKKVLGVVQFMYLYYLLQEIQSVKIRPQCLPTLFYPLQAIYFNQMKFNLLENWVQLTLLK